jgi:hypothetical protein
MNLNEFEKIAKKSKLKKDKLKNKKTDKGKEINLSFIDEIYSQSDRQMKLADAIEYLLFSRGIYYLFQSNRFKKDRVPKFLELNLRFVNLLMLYETITVDQKLRNAFLNKLTPLIKKETGSTQLKKWQGAVGLPSSNSRYKKDAPDLYFDTLLPKTAGGLWHEILVYCFILKYNIGYIFPLLLTQKPISLNRKLSPPDLIILHNRTFRYYGIEIGNLKERQSGGFMAPSGIPIIPLDTTNARISDRCPTCGKWIGICEKVIKDFSNVDSDLPKPTNEVRCLTDCSIFSLKDKLDGKCRYMKFRHKSNSWKYKFADNNHHHYHCCLMGNKKLKKQIMETNGFSDLKEIEKQLAQNTTPDSELLQKTRKKYSYIKTHSIYYQELISLYRMNQGLNDTAENIEEQENIED